jgi:hypothetical protein
LHLRRRKRTAGTGGRVSETANAVVWKERSEGEEEQVWQEMWVVE